MIRPLVPVLLILLAAISLGSLVYITVPNGITSTYLTASIETAINPEILLDYSTSTISCTGITPVCYEQVYPYTTTETWSAQTTHIVLALSTSTSYVPYATSGTSAGIAIVLIILFVGIVLLTRRLWRGHS